MLYSCALAPHPVVEPLCSADWIHPHAPQGSTTALEVFTDGSAFENSILELRRAGWSLCYESGSAWTDCYGPLPGEFQSSPKAELYALVQ
eukprot:4082037-Alexandrium_andersonii.AAC.1